MISVYLINVHRIIKERSQYIKKCSIYITNYSSYINNVQCEFIQ